jgi:hypothetical protein
LVAPDAAQVGSRGADLLDPVGAVVGHNVCTEAEPAGVVPYRAARTGCSNRMLAERGR